MASCSNRPNCLKSQNTKTTNLRKTRRRLDRLVGSLDKYESNVRRLFEIGIRCELNTETANEFLRSCGHGENNPAEYDIDDPNSSTETSTATGSGNLLFSPACEAPVPQKGRQTYRMWKAMVHLGASPFTKSRLAYHPKILHFLPLEKVNICDVDFRVDRHRIKSITELLHKFLQAFFPSLDVILEERFDVARMNPVSRIHKLTNKKQLLVTDIYSRLHDATGLDKKHFILGLTWTDLYPTEDLNFALGEALYSHNCAVLSFGRYEPLSFATSSGTDTASTANEVSPLPCGESSAVSPSACGADSTTTVPSLNSKLPRGFAETKEESLGDPFFKENILADSATDAEDLLPVTGDLLWKLMRVSSHEVCHLFGLSHCVFFQCAMNESKSVKEALEQPLQLCPICLRKLQRFLGFDVTTRYREMLEFCRSVQEHYPCKKLEETIQLLQRVLHFIS